MARRKTNVQMLCWGIKHIASNHGWQASTNYKEDGEVCIFGGCNVPTLSDVQFLCEDMGIDKHFIESSDCGIDVFIPAGWLEGFGKEPYQQGAELWKRLS